MREIKKNREKINFLESAGFRLIQFDPRSDECYSSFLSSHC